MTVASINGRSTQMLQSLVNLRAQLDDYTRQISTGKKSDTYAGLGVQRGISITLRAQLSAIESYDATGQRASMRIDLAQTALSSMAKAVSNTKSAMLQTTNIAGVGGASQVQTTAKYSLDELSGLLNTEVAGRYVFGGRQTDSAPVESADLILNGDGVRAGLVQIISERQQADLGSDGRGRLDITNPVPSSLNIAEDAVSPFGFKLASVSSGLTNAVVTGPAGSPATLEVDLSGGNPNAGESLTVRFTLPDGTTANVTLTATTNSPSGPGQFNIGALPADTAASLTAALTAAVEELGTTALTAASAVQASNEFFDADATHPPVRVDGPPFDSATATRTGSSADTVIWYTGDAGSEPARQTATALVDPSLSVGYGVRANEQGIRAAVQSVATLAAVTITSNTPNGIDLSQELNSRLLLEINGQPGNQTLSDVAMELAGAQVSIEAAKTRHTQQNSTLEEFLRQIEGVSDTEVGAQILALQTRLQASMQVTSMVYQMSLINYLN